MLERRERLLRMQTQRKRHLIRRLLTSLAVTTVAVVATLTMASTPPSATIERIGSLGNRIYYTVIIKDTESALNPESLKMIASNQLENHEVLLKTGENTGVIENLSEDTEYVLKVVGSTGYGSETLAKAEVTTEDSPGGAILTTTLLPFDPADEYHYYLTYDVRVMYQDPFTEYKSVVFKWTTVSSIDYSADMDLTALSYTTELLTSTDQTFQLQDISNYNVYVILILEATTFDNGSLVLDTYITKTPLNIEASLYVTDASYSSLWVMVYPDFQAVEGIRYELELYEGDELIEVQTVSESIVEPHYDQKQYLFETLKTDFTYMLRLIAYYIDPDTGQDTSKEVNRVSAQTTPYYEVYADLNDLGEFVQIDLLVHDPSNFIHNFTYVLYDYTSGERVYLSQAEIVMTRDLNDDKVSSFEVYIPLGITEYVISIQANKQMSPTLTYYSKLVEIMTIE